MVSADLCATGTGIIASVTEEMVGPHATFPSTGATANSHPQLLVSWLSKAGVSMPASLTSMELEKLFRARFAKYAFNALPFQVPYLPEKVPAEVCKHFLSTRQTIDNGFESVGEMRLVATQVLLCEMKGEPARIVDPSGRSILELLKSSASLEESLRSQLGNALRKTNVPGK
jgi:hypothetical protein